MQLQNFLINLKNGAIIKNAYIDYKYPNNMIFILLLDFYKKGFIVSYLVLFDMKVRIFLFYFKQKSIFEKLIVYKKKLFSRRELIKFLYGVRYIQNTLFYFQLKNTVYTQNELLLYKKYKPCYLFCKISF